MASDSQFLFTNSFLDSFDRRPFLFQHNLSHHELFTFPALHRLAKQVVARSGENVSKGVFRQAAPPGFLVVKGRGGVKWGTSEFNRVLDDAFEHFDQSTIRLKLSSIHEYDGYREVLVDCMNDLSEVTGIDFSRRYERGIETLFISSPNETTPYHIDEEVNFLLQIHGEKQVRIFDGNDRRIVSQKDLEEFWFGRAFIDPVAGSTPQIFDIGPGQGIFNPPFFPHEVHTGPRPCVSLSLGFPRRCFPEAELHRMNAYIRKLGLTPQPPGKHPRIDRVKSQVMRRATSLKRSIVGA